MLPAVDAAGTVVYDSQKGSDAMSNHRDRPEIQEAEKSGEGHVVRCCSRIVSINGLNSSYVSIVSSSPIFSSSICSASFSIFEECKKAVNPD